MVLTDKITQFSSNLALRLPSFQVNMVDLSYISKVKMSDKCKVCFHNINARNAKAQCTDAKPIFMRVVLICLKIMWNFYSHKVKTGDAMIVKRKNERV